MDEKKQFTPRVHQFTNDMIQGKSLLNISDKKYTGDRKILSLIMELNETEQIKILVKNPIIHPWEIDDYKDLIE